MPGGEIEVAEGDAHVHPGQVRPAALIEGALEKEMKAAALLQNAPGLAVPGRGRQAYHLQAQPRRAGLGRVQAAVEGCIEEQGRGGFTVPGAGGQADGSFQGSGPVGGQAQGAGRRYLLLRSGLEEPDTAPAVEGRSQPAGAQARIGGLQHQGLEQVTEIFHVVGTAPDGAGEEEAGSPDESERAHQGRPACGCFPGVEDSESAGRTQGPLPGRVQGRPESVQKRTGYGLFAVGSYGFSPPDKVRQGGSGGHVVFLKAPV